MPTAHDPLNLLLTQVERPVMAGVGARVAYPEGAGVRTRPRGSPGNPSGIDCGAVVLCCRFAFAGGVQ